MSLYENTPSLFKLTYVFFVTEYAKLNFLSASCGVLGMYRSQISSHKGEQVRLHKKVRERGWEVEEVKGRGCKKRKGGMRWEDREEMKVKS